jgi:hypothetical protein
MGLRSLQHIRRRRSTCCGFCLPATFRPQGFLTLSTVSALRCRAGFVSRRRRSWDFPFGAFSSRKVPVRLRPGGPTYRFRFRYTHRRSGWPARKPAVPGLLPLRESLAIGNVFSVPVAGCSLGFLPLRVHQRSPSPSLRPASSHALRDGDKPHSRRLRVSIGLRPALARVHGKPGAAKATHSGFLHQADPCHSDIIPAGLCVRLTPCGTSLPTIGDLGPDP